MSTQERFPFHLASESSKVTPRDRCYICGRMIGPAGERDHFPLPKSLGGALVAPICRTCHDQKDRMALKGWDPSLAFSSLAGLWLKAAVGERMVLVKMFHIVSQGLATEMSVAGVSGAEAEALALIVALRADGVSMEEIVRELRKRGVLCREPA